MKKFKITPARFITLGFAAVIVIGTLLLSFPIAKNDGVNLKLTDIFFTATSAVCVTGLATVDIGDTFSLFGRTVVAVLIQIGGLGIALISVGLIMLTGRKINLRERLLVKESMNYPTFKGVLALVKTVVIITFVFELFGAVMSFFVFRSRFPFGKALEVSIFHSIAAFNNAGFDILGNFQSLMNFKDSAFLLAVTEILIIAGGLGFFVISEIAVKRSFKKLSLHSKIVLAVSAVLLIGGTVLFKITDGISWSESFFNSVTARTAGFSVSQIGSFSNGGIMVFLLLMFIGASPGSTGGGIKTTTIFALFSSMFNSATNKEVFVFNRRLPKEIIHKSFVITLFALISVICVTFLLCLTQPDMGLTELLFETISAFATVGLSTGITPHLNFLSKYILMIMMFIGRVGPLTIATIWVYNPKTEIKRPEESISIG